MTLLRIVERRLKCNANVYEYDFEAGRSKKNKKVERPQLGWAFNVAGARPGRGRGLEQKGDSHAGSLL